MKKLISLVLSVLLVFCYCIIAQAETADSTDKYNIEIAIPQATETFTVTNQSSLASCLYEAKDNTENEYTKIIIPSGVTITVTNTLFIYSNTIIEATGAIIYKDNVSSGNSSFFINDGVDKNTIGGYELTKNIYINGGTFNGGDLSKGGKLANAITLVHASNVYIQNVNFKNIIAGHAIELNAVKNAVIQNCTFNSTLRPSSVGSDKQINSMALQLDMAHDCGGVYADKGAEHVICGDHQSTLEGYVLDDYGCSDIKILCNKFNNEKTEFEKYSIAVGTGKSLTTEIDGKFGIYQTNIEISGNEIYDCDLAALKLAGVRNLTVESNAINNCTDTALGFKKIDGGVINNNTITCKGNGIFIYAGDSDGIVSKIDSIENNSIDGGAIALYETVSGKIYNNTIKNSGTKGILLNNSTVTQNIENNNIDITEEHGIFLYSASKCFGIVGNNISHSKASGIYICNNSSADEVASNTVNDSAEAGIKVYNAVLNRVIGNTVKKSGTLGIYSNNSSVYEISSNKVFDSVKSGIYNYSVTTPVKITLNEISDSNEHGLTAYAGTVISEISNNTINNSTKNAIQLNNIKLQGDITDNKIIKSVYGISLSAVMATNISSNTISESERGINIGAESVVASISNNVISAQKVCSISATAKVNSCDISDAIPVTAVSANVSSLIIKTGQKYTLIPKVTPLNANATVTFKVYNESVATVSDKGEIKGIKAGLTTVVIKAGSKSMKIPVTVNGPATKVTPNKKSVTIGVGETFKVVSNLSPKYTYDKVLYTSSNKKIATVSSTGTIKGIKSGKVTVTAKAGNVTAKISVTIKKAPAKVTLNKKTLTLKKGEKFVIKYTLPKNTASYKITYSSSNKKVASVSSEGIIKAVKKGKAAITVKTFNGKKSSIKVTVK